MKRVYTTAMGKQVDLDALRIANEETIAVGNMKVNARGDELGPGGTIKATKTEIMEEHYRLQAAEAKGARTRSEIAKKQSEAGASTTRTRRRTAPKVPTTTQEESMETQEPTAPNPESEQAPDNTETKTPTDSPRVRGSLADAIAKEVTVNQQLIKPANKKTGPSRI